MKINMGLVMKRLSARRCAPGRPIAGLSKLHVPTKAGGQVALPHSGAGWKLPSSRVQADEPSWHRVAGSSVMKRSISIRHNKQTPSVTRKGTRRPVRW